MIKIFHISLAFVAIGGFIGRVILSEIHPQILRHTALKIVPHAIDTLLLISGIALVFQGHWLADQYGWIIAKLAVLFGYIGFGVIAMRRQGRMKWLAFVGAIACFAYIGSVAVTKQPWWF